MAQQGAHWSVQPVCFEELTPKHAWQDTLSDSPNVCSLGLHVYCVRRLGSKQQLTCPDAALLMAGRVCHIHMLHSAALHLRALPTTKELRNGASEQQGAWPWGNSLLWNV